MKNVWFHTNTFYLDTVRAFKKLHQLGRFSQSSSSTVVSESNYNIEEIQVGSRCLVDTNDFQKRATVKYVGTLKLNKSQIINLKLGKVQFAKGVWVGVEYDEPLGKHNGT